VRFPGTVFDSKAWEYSVTALLLGQFPEENVEENYQSIHTAGVVEGVRDFEFEKVVAGVSCRACRSGLGDMAPGEE